MMLMEKHMKFQPTKMFRDDVGWRTSVTSQKKLDILQKIPGISRFNLSLRKENLLFQN